MTFAEFLGTLTIDGLVHAAWTYILIALLVGIIVVPYFVYKKVTKVNNDIYGPKFLKAVNKLCNTNMTDPDDALVMLEAKVAQSIARPEQLKIAIPGIAAQLNNPMATREDDCWKPLIKVVQNCDANVSALGREKASLEQQIRSMQGTIDNMARQLTARDTSLDAANTTLGVVRAENMKLTQEMATMSFAKGEPAAIALVLANREGQLAGRDHTAGSGGTTTITHNYAGGAKPDKRPQQPTS